MGSLLQKGSNPSYIICFLLLLVSIAMSMPTETMASLPDSTDSKSVSEVLVDNNKDGELDLLGQQVTVTGIATVGTSVLNNQYLMLFLQDSSAGILAFSDKPQKTVSKGDRLEVTGKLQLYYGKPEIVVDSLRVIETGGAVPEAVKLNKALNKPGKYLGMLAEGEGLITAKENYESGFKKLTISTSDTSDSFIGVFVPVENSHYKDFNFDILSIGDFVHVKGIVDSYSPQNSDNTYYNIRPRTPEDLQYSGLPKRYLNFLLWGGGFLIIAIIGWIVTLKKQVRSKTDHLSQALEEKNMLMREIHHRVKNNLAMISGLLDLQIDTAKHKGTEKSLEDSKARIQSMALIHDKLYQTESYRSIQLDDYLKKLIKTIHETFSNKKDSVEVNFTLEELELPVDKTVTCGLLINELVVNAFKHAFNESDHGILEVKLHKKNDQAVLTIRDNGPGLPDDYGENNECLGSLLVETMAAQLEAEMDITSDGTGTVFTFVFPMK